MRKLVGDSVIELKESYVPEVQMKIYGMHIPEVTQKKVSATIAQFDNSGSVHEMNLFGGGYK